MSKFVFVSFGIRPGADAEEREVVLAVDDAGRILRLVGGRWIFLPPHPKQSN